MKWKIVWSVELGKQFEKLDQRLKKIIYRKIARLEDYPNFGKPLSHELAGFWALKVSKYRIFYRLLHDARTVSLEYLDTRGEAYSKFKRRLKV